MATFNLEQALAEAAEDYKSGKVPTKAAFAKVKRLAKMKVRLAEAARQ